MNIRNRLAGLAVLLLSLLVTGAGQSLWAENYPVKSVVKDDQVVVDYAGLPVTVHLANLEFPSGYEAPALSELSKLLQGQQVKVTHVPEEGMDNNGLPYCYIALNGGMNINQMLVKKGWAKYNAGVNPPKSFHQLMQLAQSTAQQDKVGLWADAAGTDVASNKATNVPAKPAVKALDVAPADYSGPVVADLTSKEYVLPGSRYAQSIRPAAKIEYKSFEEAERAGKTPSPFCFPDRSKQFAAKAMASASPGNSGPPASPEKVVADSKKALEDAIKLIQLARELSRNDNKGATANFKKAGKILSDALDRLTPVADASPNDQSIQSLAEEMSMNLYSCNKYQTL